MNNIFDMDTDRFELLTDIRRSKRYHDYRRSFYSKLNDFGIFLSVVMGIYVLGFLSQLEEWHWWLGVFPVVSLVISLFLTIFHVADKSTLHAELRRRFSELELRVENEDEPLDTLRNERLHIEMDEPKILRNLDTRCHNEIAISLGMESQTYHLTFLQKLFAQLFDFRFHKSSKTAETS